MLLANSEGVSVRMSGLPRYYRGQDRSVEGVRPNIDMHIEVEEGHKKQVYAFRYRRQASQGIVTRKCFPSEHRT